MENRVDSAEYLYESHLKAQHGVIWKNPVAAFSLHAPEGVLKLSKDLQEGKYKLGKSTKFSITKPKPRDILSIKYPDRVWQRTLNDFILFPTMSKSYIKENCACQPGKGVDYALKLFHDQLRRFYINHGIDGYILKLDIHHYYASLRHDLVKEMFKKKLDHDVYEIVVDILDT